ncbi:MAG TPA: hypothetical protein VFS39_02145 [Nitrospira sp.]|nr:hypothetical protein [Nitrospira sp.]
MRCPLEIASILSHDVQKAAEAAFRGLPADAQWSHRAQRVYRGILAVTEGRDIVAEAVAESESEAAEIAV